MIERGEGACTCPPDPAVVDARYPAHRPFCPEEEDTMTEPNVTWMQRTVPGWTKPPPGSIPDQIPLSRIRVSSTPELVAAITGRITTWAASVPVGTTATVFQVLVHHINCACKGGGWEHDKGCQGFATHMPLEIVRDVLLPPDGTPCLIPGVEIITDAMPFRIRTLRRTP